MSRGCYPPATPKTSDRLTPYRSPIMLLAQRVKSRGLGAETQELSKCARNRMSLIPVSSCGCPLPGEAEVCYNPLSFVLQVLRCLWQNADQSTRI